MKALALGVGLDKQKRTSGLVLDQRIPTTAAKTQDGTRSSTLRFHFISTVEHNIIGTSAGAITGLTNIDEEQIE